MAHLDASTLQSMGFGSLGRNVRISEKASLYNCAAIHLGDEVRIDDFAVLSAGAGGIHIGKHVHIAAFCLLVGAGAIRLEDFSGLSSRVSIHSSSDDYSGAAMTNPTIPPEFTNVHSADVVLRRHVIVGSGSVLLPGVTLEEGAAVGALTLVTRDCERFGIYLGHPARRIGSRKEDLLEAERRFTKRG